MFNIRITGQNGATCWPADQWNTRCVCEHQSQGSFLAPFPFGDAMSSGETAGKLYSHTAEPSNTSEHGSNDFKTGIVPSYPPIMMV